MPDCWPAVSGVQAAATCKHFAGYDMEGADGWSRYSFSADLSPQDLVDTYLPVFEACVKDAQALGFMCAVSSSSQPWCWRWGWRLRVAASWSATYLGWHACCDQHGTGRALLGTPGCATCSPPPPVGRRGGGCWCLRAAKQYGPWHSQLRRIAAPCPALCTAVQCGQWHSQLRQQGPAAGDAAPGLGVQGLRCQRLWGHTNDDGW
jgi:hypothetical protein